MSDSGGEPGRREVAYRLFAAEYDDADLSYSESDEERAPNYVVTSAGARVNRLFVVGVLTEVESVSEDYLRARVVDPTGPFVVYAGQYQPEAMGFLEAADPPTFVAVTGKARTFQPDDADRVYTSIRPESINEVDAATRDRWVVQAAEATLDRVARTAEAEASGLEGDALETSLAAAGVEEGLASGIPTALAHYGTTGEYLAALREVSLDALRVVAGERDEVEATLPAPAAGDDDPVQELAERTLEAVPAETGGRRDAVSEVTEAETAAEVPAAATDEPEGSEAETGGSDPAGAGGSETESTDTGASEAVDGTGAERSASKRAVAEEATPDAGTEPTDPGDAVPEVDVEASDGVSEGATADSPDAQVATASDAGTTTEGEPGAGATESNGVGDFEADYDLDDAEREEIESEYGTEFKSGSEVEEPGAADIETPEPAAESGADETDVTATERTTEPAPETEAEPVDTDDDAGDQSDRSTDVALDDAVMEAMADLDDGDGADRDALIPAVDDRTGAEPGAVEDAIQEALMDGRCYEPADGTLKPI